MKLKTKIILFFIAFIIFFIVIKVVYEIIMSYFIVYSIGFISYPIFSWIRKLKKKK